MAKRFDAAELAGLVDVDREPARHAFAADAETVDLRAAARLALPGRGDAPVGHAFGGVALDAVDQREQVVDIDAVDDVRRGGLHLRLRIHDGSPSGVELVQVCDYWQRGERGLDALALLFGDQAGQTLPNCGCPAPEWMYCQR